MRERIFHTIQNNETAYWIGFLAADGSIFENKLVIGLSAKDTEHLEKFKTFLEIDNQITTRQNSCNNGKTYGASYLTIKNIHLIEDLKQYGIVPNKSSQNINFLEKIPQAYIDSFICGYFDGDGWFTNTEKSKNLGFCGNFNTMTAINDYLKEKFKWSVKNKICSEHNSTITFCFKYQAKQKMLDFLNLYTKHMADCPLLTRKFQTAIQLYYFYNGNN